MRRASNIGVLSDLEIAGKNWIYFRGMGPNTGYCRFLPLRGIRSNGKRGEGEREREREGGEGESERGRIAAQKLRISLSRIAFL